MHAFNLTLLTLESERIIRREETAHRHSLILRFLEAESIFRTEVEVRACVWLLCFLNLQVEPQFLSLSEFLLIVLYLGCGPQLGCGSQLMRADPGVGDTGEPALRA